jgi:hypothetical protein
LRISRTKGGEKLRKRLFAGPDEDRVGVRRGFVRQRRDVQAAERDEDPARAVRVGDAIRAVRVGDVDLYDDEIGLVVERQAFDVLVHDRRLVVAAQVCRERREAERRKQRVLDGAPVGTGRLGQRRQDELDAERLDTLHALHCKVYGGARHQLAR